MFRIKVARTAGFCFGVARAVEMCEELLSRGERIATLGPIIHNSAVTDRLEKKGARCVASPTEAREGELVVIRSHGVPPEVYAACSKRGTRVADATCPYVAKIHAIVKAHGDGAVIIIGDRNHPEIEAVCGYCVGETLVCGNLEELKAANLSNIAEKPTIIVAQTTYNLLQYKECVEYAASVLPKLKSFDTVCGATRARQEEADRLSRQCDVMIVIGDANSSNTKKLFEVCRQTSRAYAVQSAGDLFGGMFENAKTVGVTAGGAAPADIIEEVLSAMSEEFKGINEAGEVNTKTEEEELDFEQAVERYLKRASRNQRYLGIVTSVRANEVVVDIGTKQTGIVPFDEMTDDSSVDLHDLVKVGDEINLIAVKVNDQEGIVTLSKKRMDAIAGFDEVVKAAADGSVLDAVVTEKVNAGVIAFYKGVRIFVHESQATLYKGDSLDELIKKPVRLKITEVKGVNNIRGSIRRVTIDERNKKRDELWSSIEAGNTYHGVVKSLTSYGAFVDIGGGVDGMVHISELSWGRINHPNEVVSVGDEIDVYVKSVDGSARKISLGYKKEEDNPWNKLREIPIGTTFTGPVVAMIKSGAFVRIMPQTDGFVHISQICKKRLDKPQDLLRMGQIVEARLIAVDFERQRISLSLRDENEPEDGSVVDNLPESKPAEEAPVAEAPAEEIPVVEAPVEEAPVEEAPVDAKPKRTRKTAKPAEEAPEAEAPIEEAPVEEKPKRTRKTAKSAEEPTEE